MIKNSALYIYIYFFCPDIYIYIYIYQINWLCSPLVSVRLLVLGSGVVVAEGGIWKV